MTDTQDSAESPGSPPERQAVCHSCWLGNGIACAILLGLCSGSGWLHWQSYRGQQQQKALLQTLNSCLSTYQQQGQQQSMKEARQQQLLKQQLEHQTEQLLQSQQHLALQAQQLSAVRQQLVNLSAIQRPDWQLIEAQRLVNAAGHQLWLLQDVVAARRLLQGAANLLAALEQPALLPVRQALIEDSQQLALVAEFDRETLVLQLLNGLEQVQQLPIKKSFSTVDGAARGLERASWWRSLLIRGKLLLQSLITLQQHSGSATPVTIWSESNARDQLRTHLQLAMHMALCRQDAPYQRAMNRCINCLQEHFDSSAAEFSQLAAGLRQLQRPLCPVDLPQQLQSQILLEAFLQCWFEEAQRLSVQPAKGEH